VELPRELRRILADLEGGSLQVGMRTEGLEPILERLERAGDRLVVGILAAAFIDGLGELMAANPSRWQRFAGPFFSTGLAASAGLGGALALEILRRRRRRTSAAK
jgi:ubiquinone biosynthesis protein